MTNWTGADQSMLTTGATISTTSASMAISVWIWPVDDSCTPSSEVPRGIREGSLALAGRRLARAREAEALAEEARHEHGARAQRRARHQHLRVREAEGADDPRHEQDGGEHVPEPALVAAQAVLGGQGAVAGVGVARLLLDDELEEAAQDERPSHDAADVQAVQHRAHARQPQHRRAKRAPDERCRLGAGLGG